MIGECSFSCYVDLGVVVMDEGIIVCVISGVDVGYMGDAGTYLVC